MRPHVEMHRPGPVGARSPRRAARLLGLAACCIAVLLAVLPRRSAAADLGAAMQAPEWQRLVNLWHAMLDHSSDLIYSPDLFQELVKDIDRADGDVASLGKSGLMPASVTADLRSLFHARYEHLKERHYTNQARVTLTAAEASRSAAHWVVENQLSVLRRAAEDDGEPRLVEAARSNITYQLTFLHHLNEFEAEADRRRRNLKAKEEAGETVGWEGFDSDCERRRNLLLEAYRQRRLPRVRSVEALAPYVFALTTCQASPPARSAKAPGFGS